MERLVTMMMHMIRCQMGDSSSDALLEVNPSAEELAALYRLSRKHDMAHLVGAELQKRELLPPNTDITAKFQKQLYLAAYRHEWLQYDLDRLSQALEDAAIPFLPLKGSVLRSYYPEPWMRTSCDIDVLVDPENLDRAVACLTERLGYQKTGDGSHDVGLETPNGVRVELHYTLIEEGEVDSCIAILQRVFDDAVPCENSKYRLRMSDELFYFYHIAHIVKHFKIGGCGVRPLLDLWIMEHRMSFDRDRCDALLKECSLLPFTQSVRHLSEVWFSGQSHDECTARMQEYILLGGVYGSRENRISVQQTKQGGRGRYLWRRIFPPYDSLKTRYPSLDGHRWMTPLYYVRRWWDMLFHGAWKRSAKELQISGQISAKDREKTKQLFDWLQI